MFLLLLFQILYVPEHKKGVTKYHRVMNRVEVKWFGERNEPPPVSVMNKDVYLLLPIRFLSS